MSMAWVAAIGPNMDAAALGEYLGLWPRIANVQLQEGNVDEVRWSWEQDGRFSVRSAYTAKFAGHEVIPTAEFTWKSKAPL